MWLLWPGSPPREASPGDDGYQGHRGIAQAGPLGSVHLHEESGTSARHGHRMNQAGLRWVNLDPRLPGGTPPKTVLHTSGRVLLNEHAAHAGPFRREGEHHTMRSGLCDGSAYSSGPPPANARPAGWASPRRHGVVIGATAVPC